MVMNHAICAVNVASAVLANSMCCFYEINKEEDRNRESSMIRQSVNSEWEREHFVDMIAQEEEERDTLKRQEDRRRKLMATKQSYDPATQSTRNNQMQKPNLHASPQDPTLMRSKDQTNQLFIRPCFTRPSHRPNLQVFTGPTDSYDCPLRNMSSLLDDCEIEASEDEDDFEEICLE